MIRPRQGDISGGEREREEEETKRRVTKLKGRRGEEGRTRRNEQFEEDC